MEFFKMAFEINFRDSNFASICATIMAMAILVQFAIIYATTAGV